MLAMFPPRVRRSQITLRMLGAIPDRRLGVALPCAGRHTVNTSAVGAFATEDPPAGGDENQRSRGIAFEPHVPDGMTGTDVAMNCIRSAVCPSRAAISAQLVRRREARTAVESTERDVALSEDVDDSVPGLCEGGSHIRRTPGRRGS